MREVVQSLEESRIREVANEGLGRSDVLKLSLIHISEPTRPY